MEPEPETGEESKVIVIDTETLSVVKQCHSAAVISEDKINKTIQYTTIYSIYYNIFNILQNTFFLRHQRQKTILYESLFFIDRVKFQFYTCFKCKNYKKCFFLALFNSSVSVNEAELMSRNKNQNFIYSSHNIFGCCMTVQIASFIFLKPDTSSIHTALSGPV